MVGKLKTSSEILEETMQTIGVPYLYIENLISSKGYSLLVKNCKSGDKYALYALGTFHDNGWAGLTQDFDKALYYYLLAFRQSGNIDAALRAAGIYHNSKNFKKAFSMYQRLAKYNVHTGLTGMALHYHNGEVSVNKDLNQALYYYTLAYKYGNLSAPVKIVSVYKEQKKYLKAFLMLIKVVTIVIPKRIYALFNGTMDEKIRMM